MKAITMRLGALTQSKGDDHRGRHAGAPDERPARGYQGRHRKEPQAARPAA